MGGFSIFTIIVLCLGGIFWLRQSRRRAYAVPTSPAGIPQADVVLSTFAHGNSCLAAGNFSEHHGISARADPRTQASPCCRTDGGSGAAAARGECHRGRQHRQLICPCTRLAPGLAVPHPVGARAARPGTLCQRERTLPRSSQAVRKCSGSRRFCHSR